MPLISALRSQIAARLRADETFTGPPPVDVLVEDLGDIGSEVEKRIRSGTGIVCVVVDGSLEPDDAAPDALLTTISVVVMENPTLNRGATGTQRSAGVVAEAVWALLDGWQPSDEWSTLGAQSLQPEGIDGLIVYRLTITARTVCAAAS